MFLNVLFSRCNIVVAISFFSQLWLQFIFFAMNKVCLLLFILLLVIFLCTAKNQIHNFSSFHSFFCFFLYTLQHYTYTIHIQLNLIFYRWNSGNLHVCVSTRKMNCLSSRLSSSAVRIHTHTLLQAIRLWSTNICMLTQFFLLCAVCAVGRKRKTEFSISCNHITCRIFL